MPHVSIGGVEYEITPPRRRIIVAEVGAEMGQRPLRAFVAAAGLGCRGLWARATEPKYDGLVSRYAEDLLEALPDRTTDELVLAGIDVWRAWQASVPTAQAVREARDFTPAVEAPPTGSDG